MFWQILGWVIRSVALGCVPIAINWVIVYLFERPANFATLLGKGELLLLSFGLILGALGDIIRVRPGWDRAKGVATGFSAAMILVIGVVYVPTAYPELLAEPVRASRVGRLSLGFYIFALVVSLTTWYAAKESGDVRPDSDSGVGG